ncbi:MAG TPA: hypothetical protein VGP92_07915 [Acidimicrobiia bacterium]|nr:hypothetical protein [Acidimicrobiia bacterium]
MTISPEIDTASSTTAVAAVECALCGSRLQRNDEPDVLEVGSDSLRAVARHRCVPADAD